MYDLIGSFGLIFLAAHLEGITPSDSSDTLKSGFTAEGTLWRNMYRRDRHARDRVMKSARLLLPYLKDGDTVLDVGCFTHEARKYFPRAVKYVGIDEKAYHKETKVQSLHHGFEPILCQAAICLETLEHLLDPMDTLRSILESLPPHGFLVISLPNEATIFHRIRSLLGTVDAECFSGEGKHLHLPSLAQSRAFLKKIPELELQKELYYISPSGVGSRQALLGRILSLIPDRIHQFLADKFPSLFSRGFIFLLKKRISEQSDPPAQPASAN